MQAVILAGGRGERLRPFTDDRPKPMVELNGAPLIYYLMGWLRENGVTDVVLSCGYRWQAMQDRLGDGSRWGMRVRYAVERETLGRGGGIRHAMQHLDPGDSPIVVANGDNILDVDLEPMLGTHRRTGALATLLLVPLVSVRGIVRVDEQDRVTAFDEKPELPYWINAGVYIFSRQMGDLLPEKGDHEDLLFPRLAAEGRLGAHKTRDLWRTVDTGKDLTDIARELRAGLRVPCLEPPDAS